MRRQRGIMLGNAGKDILLSIDTQKEQPNKNVDLEHVVDFDQENITPNIL